jgi:DNA-directed RNA polymerase alpha subunit
MDIIEQINNEALKSKLDTPIEELDISVRAYNCLKKANINTMLDIMHVENLIDIRNLGRICANEIYKKLLEYGIDFDDKEQCKELIEKYNNQKLSSNNNETSEPEPIPDNVEKNMNIIKLFNLYARSLEISSKMLIKLKKNKYYQVKDLIYAGYEQLKMIKDLTESELKRLVYALKVLNIDIQDKEQCQKLIKKYNEQYTRKEPLQIQLNEMELSLRLFNCLLRSGHITILDIIYDDNIENIRNLGKSCFAELKCKLLEFGIDYDNKIQRRQLIKEYNEKSFSDGVINQLEKTIDDMEDEYCSTFGGKVEHAYDEFRKNNCETLLDIIIKRKDLNWYKDTIRYFGIDIDNEKQCRELIKQYEEEKEKQKNQITVNEKELQVLNQVTNDNDSLENELTRKQKVLQEIKEQLERRKQLEQQLTECDKEYNELIKQYNSLKSKESSNNHGTK